MELSDYIRVLRTSWLIVLISAVVGLAAGGTYTALQTPTYGAVAKIVVSSVVPTSDVPVKIKNDPAITRVRTYAGLASTPDVLEPVIESLGLDTTVAELSGRVWVSASSGTSQIVIAGGAPGAQAAADLANAVAVSLTDAIEKLEDRPDQSESSIWVTTVQDATPPSAASGPRLKTNLMLGGISGLALGLAIAVLRDVFSRRALAKREQ
ncbi:hypothetical protein GCM10022381_41840 [Leifsonia kafniensis]|uniref:Polysaccharide chain length determinant N-terminal domain-containing protein n=1 Tax=Leifsonia kafniensis TaxID=475957 RepID=A0ABP7L6M9_9MICO